MCPNHSDTCLTLRPSAKSRLAQVWRKAWKAIAVFPTWGTVEAIASALGVSVVEIAKRAQEAR